MQQQWPGDQKPKNVKGSRSIIIILVLVHVGYYYYIVHFRLQLCHLTILCIYT